MLSLSFWSYEQAAGLHEIAEKLTNFLVTRKLLKFYWPIF
jgi:hypothetical protein